MPDLRLFLIQFRSQDDGIGIAFCFCPWAAENEQAARKQFALLFPFKRVIAVYSLPRHVWVERNGRLDLLFVKLEEAD